MVSAMRRRLSEGGASIGTWMQIPNASVAEIMGGGGYDWVAVDLEHGSYSLGLLPDVFRALELGGTVPLARLVRGSDEECKQVLDAGAAGVVVPSVQSADQIESVIAATRWPPAGRRGVAYSRANLFGSRFDAYREEAQAPFVVAMIESTGGIAQLDGILAVDGLDAVLIGPYDLSASLGKVGELDHPVVVEAVAGILRAADEARVPCGVHVLPPSEDALRRRLTDGHRFLAYGMDASFLVEAGNPLEGEQ